MVGIKVVGTKVVGINVVGTFGRNKKETKKGPTWSNSTCP